MARIHSVECALPPYAYDQNTLIQSLRKCWGDELFDSTQIEEFHRHVMVEHRHLALPIDDYLQGRGLEFRNNAWIRVSLELFQDAVPRLLEKASLKPEEIRLIATTSSCGIAVPSLEARLMNTIPFSKSTKRMPLFGLGCLAGVAGINRIADYLKGFPREAALLLSTELNSLTFQPNDLSVANLVSTGLFGDGAAAVLLVGDEHPLASEAPLSVEESRSAFFPDTERAMGWDLVDSGFKVVLDSKVPRVVADHFPQAARELCRDRGLEQKDIRFYVVHPGGPKILEVMEKTLNLASGELALSWESLKNHGNMSSASVLFILKEFLKSPPPKGSWGMMASMGPAFCAEISLLKT